MKKEILKKWWFWAVVVVLIGSIGTAAFFGIKYYQNNTGTKTKQSAKNGVKKQTKQNTDKKSNSQRKEAKLYNINEEVNEKNISLTVTSVKKSNGSSSSKPKDGMEFVVVYVKVVNNGKSNIELNPVDFQMKDSRGDNNKPSADINLDGETALKAGNVSAGNTVEGAIVFEEPKNDSNLVLSYKNDSLNNKKTISFKLN